MPDLSVGDRSETGQTLSFQLLETYEQLLQFPAQIFVTSLTILLSARLRLTQERIRNLTLEEENGLLNFEKFHLRKKKNNFPSSSLLIIHRKSV